MNDNDDWRDVYDHDDVDYEKGRRRIMMIMMRRRIIMMIMS